MIPLKVRVPLETADAVCRLHPHLKEKVRYALEAIVADPAVGSVLKDEFEGLMSFRVGGFRVIYPVCSGSRVEIAAIGPRRVIYEETLRLLKKEG